MKNLILIITCFTLSLSCKAQQIVPLDTYPTYIQNNDYLKDLNNELDFFIGTYQTNYQGNTYTLYITKIIKKPIGGGTVNYFQDVLSMRYTIEDSSGQIIEDTQNMNFTPNQRDFTIYSLSNLDSAKFVAFSYGGIGCNIGSGRILLQHKGGHQFSFKYRPEELPYYPTNCPNLNNDDIKLPAIVDEIIFTKQ